MIKPWEPDLRYDCYRPLVRSSEWTGRDTHIRTKFGFKSKNQLSLFMVYTEFWNEDESDVDFARVEFMIDWDRIEWRGGVFIPSHRAKMVWRRFLWRAEDQFKRWIYDNSKCSVCKQPSDCYPFVWVHRSYCPEHCPGHEFEHERGIGWNCKTCGEPAPIDFYNDDYD